MADESQAKLTDMAKAYEPAAVEDGIYADWEKSGYFNPDNLPGDRSEPFTIIMPPPNATGTLHIGHAMFMTLQDMMTRFARMRGKSALWLPGTDHAAIATQTKVEKIIAKEGKTKHDLGREQFLKRVDEFVEGSRSTIRKQLRKMGSSCDWSRECFTLDEPRSFAVRTMFKKMYDDGLIYRGYRIVNWCPRCESTLADDEVEYKEEAAKLYYMKYGPFTVATTRPETKLGDTGVAVNPDDARYKEWIGKTFTVNFGIGEQEIRVIADASVDMSFGSGVVGLTPAHSAVDFAMAEKNGLPVKKIIGEDGKMLPNVGQYAGLMAAEARAKFVADLEALGLIEKVEDFQHNVSVCYRCGAVIEPLTSRQWFVDVDREIPGRGRSLKTLSIEAVRGGDISIVPDRFAKVYFHWMENLRDWCVSRQIWYGHRIPVWYCQGCHVETDDSAKGGQRRPGVIVAVEAPTACPDCGGHDLKQEDSSLDTWFSSGMWTFSTLGWPGETTDLKKYHPTDVMETSYDILFFWVARMVLMTTYVLGEVPFRTVYLHGLVRDEQGRKMSKSLENIIDPLDVSAKYGTDAVRLSLVIGNTPGNDLKMSEEKIAGFRNFANKLWNVSRFILMGEAGGSTEPVTLADRWIISRLNEVTASVTKDLDELNFSRAGETLRDFTWNDLADWYLEVAKIEGGKGALLRRILADVLKLWHPFVPFVTEAIWRQAFAQDERDLLMVASWPEAGAVSTDAAADFALLQSVIGAIRNLRAEYKVEPGKRLDVTLHAGDQVALIEAHAAVIRGLARVENLTVVATGERLAQSASAVAAGITVLVPLGSLVDADAERARLGQEIEETRRYVASLEGKLNNADFVARAPAAVVEGERVKLTAAQDRVDKLATQLAELG